MAQPPHDHDPSTCAPAPLPWQLTMLENMYPRQVLEFAMSGSGANSNLGSLAYEHEDVSLARGGKGAWGRGGGKEGEQCEDCCGAQPWHSAS